jgi:hypothetical protein
MSAPEEPIERLNYFNGQRLEAADFRSEQEYQLRVRRLLNSSLYSSGVVKGLEVFRLEKYKEDQGLPTDPSDAHKVLVQPGLAFDHLGREIILLDPQEVTVVGTPTPGTTSGVVFGNYLVISYAEERALPVSDACSVAVQPQPCRGDLAWGAPTRIRAEPRLEFVDAWPADESGEIVLAQIKLNKDCEVEDVNQGVSKYAVPAKAAKVRPISLEGEKDINNNNSKVLYFHVEGGYPESITLYLRGAQFSTLYYTEMGKHKHAIRDNLLDVEKVQRNLKHDHKIKGETSQGETSTDGQHIHRFRVDAADINNHYIHLSMNNLGGSAWYPNDDSEPVVIESEGEHFHSVHGLEIDEALKNLNPWEHDHEISGNTDTAGASNREAKSDTPALEFVNDLRIWYDGTEDLTGKVLDLLEERDNLKWGSVNKKLGDHSGSHAFVTEGTGKIELYRLIEGDIGPGEHSLEFLVEAGGGKILYNLYVD